MSDWLNEDRIDTRDLQARYDELTALSERDEDETEELAILQLFMDELDDSVFRNEETLIAESDFQQYAEDLFNDTFCGDRKQLDNWPFTCIDWEEAANQLEHDYTSITIKHDGNDYSYLYRG